MKMNKGACGVMKVLGGEEEMALVNAQALTPLHEDQVFLFRIAAADDRVDRDYERFTPETLRQMAPMYVGKTVIMDHYWSAQNQTARIYAADVEESEGVTRLILRAYMLRTESAEETIAAIEGGILREVSVGCAIEKILCSICGEEYGQCQHIKGRDYEGETCHGLLTGARDAYEVSFVAVPAQRGAGVIKRFGVEDDEEFLQKQAQALQLQEEKRF